MIERAAAGSAANLDTLSIGDHHNQDDYYQNTPMLGRLLAEWNDKPAGCLFLVPLWHPVIMAEHIGTLAAIHSGPFIVQTGLGGGERQFAAMGVDIHYRPSLFEETVRVVRALLAGETVSSERLGISDAHLGVGPPEPVEWWIGGAAEPAVDRAARLGDGFYGGPTEIEPARAVLRHYLDRCEAYGRTPTTLAARADVIVTADSADARSLAEGIVAAGYRGGMTIDSVIAGSPEQVAERFGPLGEIGYDEIVCRCMTVPQSVALETIGLLGEVRALLN